MLQVLERFPQIGLIDDYMDLPSGERALYEQHVLLMQEEESKRLRCLLFGKK